MTLKDHPRLCGEKGGFPHSRYRELGSPPPMRGKEYGNLLVLPGDGITPAYAGKSFFRCHISYLHKDHPRLCGEKVDFHKFIFHKLGSPPPMRGKVFRCGQKFASLRITPAYAGKSPMAGRKMREKEGSPPPMRGKAHCTAPPVRRPRITPAYAGKRSIGKPMLFLYQDHPRLCGEKFYKSGNVCGAWGSPPPMRGKGSSTIAFASRSGITPAYAGKSDP